MEQSIKPQPPGSFKVNIDECEGLKCKCGGEDYDIIWKLKKIPALLSKSGGEELLSLAYFRCLSCGKVSKIMKR